MNMDPTEPLRNLAVKPDGTVFFTLEQPELGCPCDWVGWLGCEWLYRREPRCTCGAGDPTDINLLHDVSCDSVPCPFCPLEAVL
jgi:hypothetical protein